MTRAPFSPIDPRIMLKCFKRGSISLKVGWWVDLLICNRLQVRSPQWYYVMVNLSPLAPLTSTKRTFGASVGCSPESGKHIHDLDLGRPSRFSLLQLRAPWSMPHSSIAIDGIPQTPWHQERRKTADFYSPRLMNRVASA